MQGGSQLYSRSSWGDVPNPRPRVLRLLRHHSKFAGVIGPAVFALVGQLTGTSRLSILSLIVFFVAGALILTRVNEAEGIRVAQAEDALA